MDINFQQLMAEAGEGFQPLPAGPYTVECEKAEPTLSKSSQAPQVRVTLRVLGGAHNGRKLFDQFTITAGNPVALGFFFDNMAAFGLDRSFFAGLTQPDPMPYVAQMLLGRQANVSVVMDQYQGVDRNKIKTYRPIQGGQPLAAAQQNGMPGMIPQPGQFTGAMPVMQQAPQQAQPQFPPQGPPAGFPPQPPFVPQQPQPPMAPQPPQMPQQMPTPPMPQVPPVQEQPQYAPQAAQPAPWQQAQEYPPQQPQGNPGFPQQPVAPGEQQGQPQGAPMWQPSGPPPGYVDPNQPQQAPQPQYQQPPQQPQGVPPMPGRSI